MSRIFKSWVLAALTSLFLLAGVLISAPAVAADFEAPAPVPNDPCETSQDNLVIGPPFNHPVNGWGGYYIDGNSAPQGTYSMSTATSVVVTTDYNSGSWTFNFTNDGACPAQAPHGYSYVVGACQPDTGRTIVNAIFHNTDDATDLSVGRVDVKYQRWDGPGGTDFVTNIADGQSKPIALDGFDGGLYPGTYTLLFFLEKNYSVVAKRLTGVFVPACGDEVPPDGDPGPGGTSVKPKGKLKQAKDTTVVCGKAINKKVTKRTKFRQIGKMFVAGRVIALNRLVVVKAGQNVKLKCFRAPVGTVVKLKAKMNGKFKPVAKLRVQRRLS